MPDCPLSTHCGHSAEDYPRVDMYSAKQLLGMSAALLLALAGVLNCYIWTESLVGLSPKQLAIIGFIPAGIIAYFILSDPRASSR